MKIENETDLEAVLRSAFPDEIERKRACNILELYGKETFHREIPRVRAAIIKAADSKIEELDRCTDIACCDYRDILCIAEYPKQSKRWGLKKNDPTKYKRLIKEDLEQYTAWVRKMKGA